MPQTNYNFYLNIYDLNNEAIYSDILKSGVTLQRGKEYLFSVLFDPNDTGDGTFSYGFREVVDLDDLKTYSSTSLQTKTSGVGKEVSNTSASPKSYKVKDLL